MPGHQLHWPQQRYVVHDMVSSKDDRIAAHSSGFSLLSMLKCPVIHIKRLQGLTLFPRPRKLKRSGFNIKLFWPKELERNYTIVTHL